MGVISKEDYTLVSGRGVGNTLTEFLDLSTNRAWIVSPNIDEKYAKRLMQKADSDVDVKLVTLDDESQEDSHEALGTRKTTTGGVLYRYRYPFIFMTILSLIGLGLGLQYQSQFVAVPVALSIIFAGLTVLAYVSRKKDAEYSTAIDLYTDNTDSPITGSRIYLLDDKVLVGSAELTEDSLWRNMEVLFQLRDEEAKQQIESMFLNIVDELEKH